MYCVRTATLLRQTWHAVVGRLGARDRIFLLLELCISVTVLSLFADAYPDRYRSALWEEGGLNGWNSNPKLRIYFYANHKEPPEIPLLWTQRLTDSSLAVAVLGFVVLVIRTALKPTEYLPLWMEAVNDVLLVLLWAVNVSDQASGDPSDPEHPSRHPWYLTRRCSGPGVTRRDDCRLAQASFAVSALALLHSSCRLAAHAWDAFRCRQRRRAVRDQEALWDGKVQHGLLSGFDEEGTGNDGHLEVDRVYEEALSPVLAFFP